MVFPVKVHHFPVVFPLYPWRSLVERWTPWAPWAGTEGAWADGLVPAPGRGGCGCPPHSPSSWEILALLPSLSFSFDPCCPCLQEYIRRQLEEEQRQLEILQQQLLQEQALLLVNGRPQPRLPLSARVASACAHVRPCPPECLLPPRGVGDAAVTAEPRASRPVPWLRACLDSPCRRFGLGPLTVHGSLVASFPRRRHARALMRGAALFVAA